MPLPCHFFQSVIHLTLRENQFHCPMFLSYSLSVTSTDTSMHNEVLCTAVHSICLTIVKEKETARSSWYTFGTQILPTHICMLVLDVSLHMVAIWTCMQFTWMIMAQWVNNESKFIITERSTFNSKLKKCTAWFSGHLTSYTTQPLAIL